MSWLEKLQKGYKTKAEQADVTALNIYSEKLKSLVYDDEIVKELAPVFAKLHGQEGFEKVFELLETKEQQIAAISGGEWFEQETNQDNNVTTENPNDADENTGVLTAEQILTKKYEEK